MSNQDDLSRLLFGMPNLCSGVVSNRRATGPSRFCIKIDVRGARSRPITGQMQVMGHSQAEKAATHQRIVDVAARRFRELGLDGIGVADVMKEAFVVPETRDLASLLLELGIGFLNNLFF